MTSGPPSRPGVHSLRWRRERLVQLGLADELVVITETPRSPRLGSSNLEPTHYSPDFGALVQHLARLLRAGRGLSVYVTGPRPDHVARQQAALQLALGLTALGRQVVLADTDFLRPGLGGLVSDPEAEGVIDMLRFGRSCRSLLVRPVAAGPWLLPAGSLPVEDPMPLGPEALRSLVYRVSQVCELALYVGPLPLRNEINPLARVCDHVVYAAFDEDSEATQSVVEAAGGLQKQNAHLAGVVLYAGELEPALPALEPEAPAPLRAPDFLPPPALERPARLDLPEPAAASPWPTPAPEAPVAAGPPAAAGRDSLPELAPVSPPGAPHSPPAPSLVPELPPIAPVGSPSGHRFATRSRAQDEEEGGDLDLDAAPSPRAVPRSREEALQLGGGLDIPDSEFALDQEGRYSRAPLFLLVALIVLIVGFGGWALLVMRGARNAEQAPAPRTETVAPAPSATPDDQAALGSGPTTPPAPADRAAEPQPTEPRVVDPAPPPAQRPVPAGPAPAARTTTPGPETTAPGGRAATGGGGEPAARRQPVPKPAPPSAPPAGRQPPAAAAGVEYTVHLASYKKIEQAYEDIASVQKAGFEARAVRTDLGSKGIWYRVYVGSYPSAAEAARARDALMKIPGHDYGMVIRAPRE